MTMTIDPLGVISLVGIGFILAFFLSSWIDTRDNRWRDKQVEEYRRRIRELQALWDGEEWRGKP